MPSSLSLAGVPFFELFLTLRCVNVIDCKSEQTMSKGLGASTRGKRLIYAMQRQRLTNQLFWGNVSRLYPMIAALSGSLLCIVRHF